MNRSEKYRGLAAFLLALICSSSMKGGYAADDTINLRLSIGSTWQQSNDVQIPNNEQSTRFSLQKAAGDAALPLARLEVNWNLSKRHGFRALLAPLEYTKPVVFDQPVRFVGASYNANETVDATYRFNSWRLGYHYTFKDSDTTTLKIGGTLKVRDAEIRLAQGNTESSDDDLGLVPLLYVAAEYRLGNRWTVGADLDGLAGGPGRAIDAGVLVSYKLTNHWQVGLEARVLDGGADTDDVYNFAQFTSAALTVSANL